VCQNWFVPWLKRLVVGLLPWRPGLDPRPVRLVADGVALGEDVVRVLGFSAVIIFPQMLLIHSSVAILYDLSTDSVVV
jgi:hypothetical protein